MEIQNFSHCHINGKIASTNSNVQWKFTGFYGHPEAAKRHEAWDLLRLLGRFQPTPWICIEDFNEVVGTDEKMGGCGRSKSQIKKFQSILTDCDLADLGFRGPKYTWSNCQEGQALIKERIDRGVANLAWCDLFPDAEVWVDSHGIRTMLCLF